MLKKIFMISLVISIIFSLTVKAAAKSSIDVEIPSKTIENIESHLSTMKEIVSRDESLWPLPNGTKIEDIHVDKIFVSYMVDLDRVASGKSVKESIRSERKWTITTKAKDQPYIVYWVADFGYIGHGDYASPYTDVINKCEKDGNYSSNIIVEFNGGNYLLAESSSAREEICYPIGESSQYFIGGDAAVSLDRLRYNYQVNNAYYKAHPLPEGSGGGHVTADTLIASGFVVPDSISPVVDYVPVEKSSKDNSYIIWSVAIAAILVSGAGLVMWKRRKAR